MWDYVAVLPMATTAYCVERITLIILCVHLDGRGGASILAYLARGYVQ